MVWILITSTVVKKVPEVIYQVLEEPLSKDALQGRSDIPQTLEEFMSQIKESRLDAKTFAVKLREMVLFNIKKLDCDIDVV